MTPKMKFVVLHVGIGPLIGLLYVIIIGSRMSNIPVILANIGKMVFFSPFAYWLGAVPALLHALLMLIAFQLWPDRRILALTPISGFAANAEMSLTGAVAAMGCMVLAYRFGLVTAILRPDGPKAV